MKNKKIFTNSEIRKIYPVLATEKLFENQHPYKLRFLSVFDHWLTQEECRKVFMEEKEKKYEKKIIKFYLWLYQKYNLYVWLNDEWNTPEILFSSDKENNFILMNDYNLYVELTKSSLEKNNSILFRLLVPELGIIVNSGHDYTLPIFIAPQADSNTVESIAKDNKLYLLD